jgi:uncharacterized lipoprotein YajG
MRLALLLLTAAALLLQGCAHPRVITIDPEIPEVRQIKRVATLGLRVEDKRAKREGIGYLKAPLGNHIGDIFSERPVEEVIGDSLQQTLEDAGYKLAASPGTSAAPHFVLKAEILELSVTNNMAGVNARADIRLTLLKDGKAVLDEDEAEHQDRFSDNPLRSESLEKVLNEAVGMVLEDAGDLVTSKKFMDALLSKDE